VELWAAIDLLGGSVVTLRQGREDQRTSWKQGAVELAARWESEGADGLHIIDLDAAFGKSGGSNQGTILSIVERAGIPVQVGGGVRSQLRAEELLRSGAFRVILGTIAYAEPAVLAGLLHAFGPERIVVAADYSPQGIVMTKGWTSSQGFSVFEAAEMMESKGVLNLLVTAVGQDGMASGPDIRTVKELCALQDREGKKNKSSRTSQIRARGGGGGRGGEGIKILASGGIRDVADLEDLAEAGATGAIIGRALYDGGVKLAEAKAALTEIRATGNRREGKNDGAKKKKRNRSEGAPSPS
jgi:phosphoribosylformimino-5-aminoimidazole carboxamide ribotide isomerase